MDCGRWSGYAIEINPDGSAPLYPEPVISPSNDQSIWATEDDYRSSRLLGDSAISNSKSKAIGRMFFKTKLCCKFRSGTCPFVTNCNFAHGMEELRKPPPNWQEIVAAHEEEHQIPILTSSAVAGDGQRSYKGRHCKKFYTDEGCPYGDMCSFLHDEESKARESEAINLSSTVGGGGYGAGGSGSNQKPSNWKTRICNKWEMTGCCPFGSKCHFAHGAAGLCPTLIIFMRTFYVKEGMKESTSRSYPIIRKFSSCKLSEWSAPQFPKHSRIIELGSTNNSGSRMWHSVKHEHHSGMLIKKFSEIYPKYPPMKPSLTLS